MNGFKLAAVSASVVLAAWQAEAGAIKGPVVPAQSANQASVVWRTPAQGTQTGAPQGAPTQSSVQKGNPTLQTGNTPAQTPTQAPARTTCSSRHRPRDRYQDRCGASDRTGGAVTQSNGSTVTQSGGGSVTQSGATSGGSSTGSGGGSNGTRVHDDNGHGNDPGHVDPSNPGRSSDNQNRRPVRRGR